MKVVLNGKEIKCHNFCELNPGDVFGMGQCIYIKTNQNHCCSLVSGVCEAYNGQPIVIYEDATLVLDPADCHHPCK